MDSPETVGRSKVQSAIEVTIPLLVVGGLLYWCLRLLMPFLHLVVWGGVLAVALFPVVSKIAGLLGGRRKLAIAVVIVLGLAILFVPVLMITASLIDSAVAVVDDLDQGGLEIPPPPDKVAGWPVVGERIDRAWLTASQNLQTFFDKYHSQVRELSAGVLGGLAAAGGQVMVFVLALLVSGLLMANAEATHRGFSGLANRLAGEGLSGEELLGLSVATVRTVVTGVLGVAVIQAVLAGLGILAFGIPAAGVLALLVLLVAIAQLPPLLVLLPVALWFFGSTDSQLAAWGFLVFAVLVNLSDVVLKPLLLGRGVNVPTLVILLGAIGGLVNGGIVGLFVGAVVLTLGYKLFVTWLQVGAGEDVELPEGALGDSEA